jgi:hemolysin activation/secretion protein
MNKWYMNQRMGATRLPIALLGLSIFTASTFTARSAWGEELSGLNIRPVEAIAQESPTVDLPPVQDILPPSTPPETLPPDLPAPLPSLDELLRPPTTTPDESPLPPALEEGDTVVIERFQVEGSTVFSDEQFAAVTAPYTNRPITFVEILAARSAVTQLYLDNGYITSGAIFPPQRLQDGVVIIQAIEGSVEAIDVQGTRRLRPSYIQRRLARVTRPPLQVEELIAGLELLQTDPLIANISADLQAGTQPGTNRLVVTAIEADSFAVTTSLNNDRSPNVGSWNRQIGITQGNMSGIGDALSLSFTNTSGVNELQGSYALPVNAREGRVQLDATLTTSRVTADEFEVLDISSLSNQVSLSFQQPIMRSTTQELSLGLALNRQYGQTRLGIDDIGPFPLSPGADERGRTTVTTLGFSQTWTHRDAQQVFSLRSQFDLGIGLLGATVSDSNDRNDEADPDSRFLSWQGQAQWVRLLAPDTLLLVRGSGQLASEPLLSQAQFGLGGRGTVRGYRQDLLLTDSGVQGSIEARVPLVRVPDINGVLQITPFVDAGYSWNAKGERPDPNALVGVGLGLLWQQPRCSVRLDWGIPLTSVDGDRSTLQENGVYLTVNYSLF